MYKFKETCRSFFSSFELLTQTSIIRTLNCTGFVLNSELKVLESKLVLDKPSKLFG